MKNTILRYVSLLLIMVMLVQVGPLTAFAADNDPIDLAGSEFAYNAKESEYTNYADANESQQPDVLFEETNLRAEASKHFRLSDGSYIAVQYDTAVHYEDDIGRWEDIDNTLRLQNNAEALADNHTRSAGVSETYTAQNASRAMSFPAEISDGTLFDLHDNEHGIQMRLGLETADYDLEAASNSDAVEAPVESAMLMDNQNDQGDEMLLAESNGIQYASTFSPDVYAIIADALSNPQEFNETKADITNPEEADNRSEFGSRNDESDLYYKLLPPTLSSEINYPDVLDGVDLKYNLYGFNLKESIILNRPRSECTFIFSINLDNLVPELNNETGAIQIMDGDDLVYEMPAPFMYDAAGSVSNDVVYGLKAADNDTYVIIIHADPSWINSEDRVFPVTIDPSIFDRNSSTNLSGTYVNSSSPNTNYSSSNWTCASNSNTPTKISYINLNALPQIPDNCVVTYAQLVLFSTGATSDAAATVQAREVTTARPSGMTTQQWLQSITYSTRPAYSDIVLDYFRMSDISQAGLGFWDVTPVVKAWIETGNNNDSHMLAMTATGPNTPSATFYSSANASSNTMPYLTVIYRNTVGLENYYSYQQESIDRAGSLYLNNFTGQTTLVRSDVSRSNSAFTFNLSHVYNSAIGSVNFSNNEDHGIHTLNLTSMKFGKGWKISGLETVVPKVSGNNTWLVYNDSDGTEHWFWPTSESGKYADEDGLGYTISKTTSGSNTIYTMTDTDESFTKTFYNGYLNEISDANGNKFFFAYNNAYSSDSSSWKPTTGNDNQLVQIAQLTNLSGAPTRVLANLVYDNGYLSEIKDFANRSTTFTYDSLGHLTQITNPDGTSAYYSYSDDKVSTAYDSESKYGVSISYNSATDCVSEIREYTSSAWGGSRVYGGGFSASKQSALLTEYRFYGANHQNNASTGTDDDLLVYYSFDNYGRTINSYTVDSADGTIQGVTSTRFSTSIDSTSKTNNALTSGAVVGVRSTNLMLNSSLEKSGSWYQSRTDSTNSHMYYSTKRTINSITVSPRTGSRMAWLVNGGTSGYVAAQQTHTLTAGVTYTFSAYVNTQWLSPAGNDVYLGFYTTSGTKLASSRVIDYKTDPAIENGWERLSVTYTPSTTGNYVVRIRLDTPGSNIALDDAQLEEGTASGSFNLVQAGSFESNVDTYWSYSGIGSISTSTSWDGAQSMQIAGNYDTTKQVTQTIPINRPASGTTFVLSGWGKANSVGMENGDEARWYGMSATIKYSDGTQSASAVSFNPNYTDWQFGSCNVAPAANDMSKTISEVVVTISYDYNENTAWFDDVSLIMEPVATYSYDGEGNLISATDGTKSNVLEYYASSKKLQKYTDAAGIEYTFTYDENNNLLSVTNDDVTTNNTCSTSGQLLSSTTTYGEDPMSPQLISRNTYTGYGMFVYYAQDINGVATGVRSYGTTYLLPYSFMHTNGTIQRYSYNTLNDRLALTYINGVIALNYDYQDGIATNLYRKTFDPQSVETYQQYSMPHDSFGNTTSISVSKSTDGSTYSNGRTLATYTYDPSVANGRLTRMTYGNGAYADYDYDKFDRVTEKQYSDGTSVKYVYNGEGALSEQREENSSGNTLSSFSFEYDSLGRLIRSRKQDGSYASISTEHLYDATDRLTSQSWILNNSAAFTEAYTYNAQNGNLATMTTASGAKITLNYDPIMRLTDETTSVNGTDVFSRSYAYRNSETTQYRSTTQVTRVLYDTNTATLLDLGYDYASSGNISEVTDNAANTTLATYTYDSQDFLTNETVRVGNTTKAYTYTYDTGGNLLSTSDGTTTHSYAYTDSDWSDLLTAYDGHTLSYDAIGNPTSYYNGSSYTMTWQRGHDLATVTKSGTTTSYTYDMDGIRSSKTVGSLTTDYYTLNGQVVRQVENNNTIDFIYDANQRPYALIYTTGVDTPETYYYLLNLQGDVVGLMDANANVVAKYTYNAWGKLLAVVDANGTAITSSSHIANINPLRYRGYYWDAETGFYYLQNRYYDSSIGRFINADKAEITILSAQRLNDTNLFSYCRNNPVVYYDYNGEIAQVAIGAIVGFFISGISTYMETGDIGEALVSGAVGAGVGALASMGGLALFGAAALAGTYTAITTEGDTTTKIQHGVISAGSTLFWGSLGGSAVEIIEAGPMKQIGEALFDLEFGVVATLTNSALQTIVPTTPKTTKSATPTSKIVKKPGAISQKTTSDKVITKGGRVMMTK